MKRLLWIFAVLFGVAILATLAGLLLSDGPAPLISGPTVLSWRVATPIADYVPAGLFTLPGGEPPPSLALLYRGFLAAREDRSVRGLAVYIQDADFGLATAQELRRQLRLLSEAGKFIECYLETAGEGSNGTLEYYLATACDEIVLAPAGELNLLGLYAEGLFLRGTLDKLRIEPAFLHIGRFKSAAELFTEPEHSPAAEAALGAVLDSDYEEIVAAIAGARKLSPEVVRAAIDGAPYGADEALALGLVDRLAYPDEFRQRIDELAGGEPRRVGLLAYSRRQPDSPLGRRLAVVFAQGTILRGSGGIEPWTGETHLGSDDMARLLTDLEEDPGVVAVVLRIDSPGGSALASDLILRQVERLAAAKPVVVSMSDLAASGGYYIATKAQKIVAEPATLTGSIGVVGGKFATRRFQQELLGITHDPLARGANAGLYSSLEPFSPAQEEQLLRLMRRVYDTFIGHVAAGRGLPPAAVEAIAEGRVWTGAAAKEIGLVDELGGLDRAIAIARELGDVAPAARLDLAYYPEAPSLLDWLLREQEPELPAELRTLLAAWQGRTPQLLELSHRMAALAQPF